MAHMHRKRSEPLASLQPATCGRLIRWAGYYDPVVSLLTLGRRAQLRQATAALAGMQPGEHVLEVGCGTGDVALAASIHVGENGRVVGIDAAPEMIAVAHTKAAQAGKDVTFQVGVIEALAFSDATFDVVLSSLMMHHLPDDLKREGLGEIARVLKPGGRLLIVDMKRPTSRVGRMLTNLAMHGHLERGIQDLPPMLHAAGFMGIDMGDIDFRLLGFVRAQTAR